MFTVAVICVISRKNALRIAFSFVIDTTPDKGMKTSPSEPLGCRLFLHERQILSEGETNPLKEKAIILWHQ